MNSRYETLALQARKLKLTELAPANRETAGNMQDGIQPAAGKSEEALSVDLGDCPSLRADLESMVCRNSRTVATIARAHSLTHWAERCSADLLAA